MGAAAYNRGSALLSTTISRETGTDDAQRQSVIAMMDSLNLLQRSPTALRPFGPIRFVAGHGGWYAECPTTGHGFWYRSLRMSVSEWAVTITEASCANGVVAFLGIPS